jgi:flagellar biogenesis protein FliO
LAGWVLAAMSSLGVTGPGRPSERRMKVVERLAIGAKKELLLVLCGGEHFLIGTGPDGVQTIAPVARQTARVATPEGLTR